MAPTHTVVDIMNLLPHRFPFLLVDRIVEFVPGKYAVGLKNVTFNEPCFTGHFPGNPIFPGVLIVEAMAQAGAVILLSEERYKGFTPILAGVENARFRKQVVPGDQLFMRAELLWIKRNIGRMSAVGTVDGEVAAEMEMTFALLPRASAE